jgi:hypothetical protein
MIVSAILLLYPVIASPITADDRYWYVGTAAGSDGSFVQLVGFSWERLLWHVDIGRMVLLAEIERRFIDLGIIEVAVATSTPITVYQALLKLGLLGGGILCVLAFVRSLRWRTSDGTLARVSRRTLVLVGVAGTLAVAVGVQATRPSQNGWIAYPVLTYGAVAFTFGSIALLLWLTRLVAERSRAMAVGAAVVLALLAVATILSYELVFPAVPVAALALLVIPVTDRAHRAAGRRAKLVTGLAYVGTFIPIFVAARLYLANTCVDQACYSGVQMKLGIDAMRATAYTFVAAIPGSSDSELLRDLDAVGWAHRYPVMPEWWSVLAGLLALSALSILWWAMRSDIPSSEVPEGTSISRLAHRRAEAHMLAVGAVLTLLVALGAAAVMGIGSRTQDRITDMGQPYRNIVVTWTGLAFCLVLAVVALGLIFPRRRAVMTWIVLAIAIGTVATLTLPGNLMALRAARITHAVTDAINWEVVQGDTSQSGDARRCQLFDELDQQTSGYVTYARESIKNDSSTAFEIYHGAPFCSEFSPARDTE